MVLPLEIRRAAAGPTAPPRGLHVGTSGWVYKHWKGIFYPEGLRPSGELEFYAERFPTVEINVSFYRLPARSVFEAWKARTPPGFLFAVKASRYLTHMKKLKDPEEPLALFMEHAQGLGRKLGPILFQFPGTWPVHLDRLEGFLAALSAYPRRRFAFEFRHESWLVPEVRSMLARAGAMLCIPVGPGIPFDGSPVGTSAYLRMHAGSRGTGYGSREIAAWADRIRGYLRDGVETFVYFNNDPDGHALRDAVRLEEALASA